MSFATHIIPQLGQSIEDDEEWYVKAMHQALNDYMADIEIAMNIPQFLITGTTTVPGTPPVPVPIVSPTAKVSNIHTRLVYEEVKAAMWCGDGNLTFPNLFKLFASKLMMNFMNVYDNTIVGALSPFTFDAMTAFNNTAELFITQIKSIGASRSNDP